MKTTTGIVILVIAIGVLLALFPLMQWIDSHKEVSSAAGVSAINRGTIENINGRVITIEEDKKEYFVPESAEILEGGKKIELEDLEIGDRVEITMEKINEGEMKVVEIRVIV